MASSPAERFLISCYSCKVAFDALESTFCSCITKTRSLVCPNCLHCFCSAPAAFIRSFWTTAPVALWQRREELRSENAVPVESSAATAVILVVDDDPDIQAVAMHVLSSFGYQVALASDGVEALERARHLRPSLILTDALLPRLDGRELCRQLKSDPETARVPVVIMTAVYKAGRYRAEAMRDFGADDFVLKPLDVSELRETVARFLG